MPALHEVLRPGGGPPSRSLCCLPVSWLPGDPMKIAPLLVVVGSARLLVNNGRFVCGGAVICGMLVEVDRVDVSSGGIDSVVDADVEVLDVLESVSVSDSEDVVDVVLELVVKAAGGDGDGGPGNGGVVGAGKDVESSSSSDSSRAVSSLSSASSASVSSLSSSSSLLINELVLSNGGVCRPSRMSSSSCCLACARAAAHCSPLRRAL